MSSSEGIIDIDVTMRSKLLSKIGNFLWGGLDLLAIDLTLSFFGRVESQVFEKNNLTVFGFSSDLGGLITDAIFNEGDILSNEL